MDGRTDGRSCPETVIVGDRLVMSGNRGTVTVLLETC